MQLCQDIPWVVACGGQKGEVSVWDMSEDKEIDAHFKSYLIEDSYDVKDYNKDAAADEYESMSDEMEDEEDNEDNDE